MNEAFQAIRISEHVWWVGAIDWGIREFHGYATSRGSTYNAFLVMADKITLIDTVKRPFCRELLTRIASVVDPRRIDYIVSNHAEMDHSGCLPEVVAAVQPERIFTSAMGAKALRDHFHTLPDLEVVKNGGSLSLGNLTLRFAETRMLHWPDSMVAFLDEDRMLFSQDAFGMHLASCERFADELDATTLHAEARKYYANILTPYSNLVSKLVDSLPGLNWDIALIAPDHGPIWRQNPMEIVRQYSAWAEQAPSLKAVVAYDTMWGSTDIMARAIADGLAAGGAKPHLCPLASTHRSDVATEVLEAGALLVGSPTINSQMYPTVADLLAYLKGLKPKNLVGAAFGSHGWNARAVPLVSSALEEMGVELVAEGAQCVYVPKDEDLARCRALGLIVAEHLTRTMKS